MTANNPNLQAWVDEIAKMTKPEAIHWCDGTQGEYDRLVEGMLETGELFKLNEEIFPGCVIHRSNPTDVARTEHLTFICTQTKEDAGPTNNWMAPGDGHRTADALFEGCMKGRTM